MQCYRCRKEITVTECREHGGYCATCQKLITDDVVLVGEENEETIR